MEPTKRYDLLALARAGDPGWLTCFRSSWHGDRAPRTFTVGHHGALFDPTVAAVRQRRDVFDVPPSFVSQSACGRTTNDRRGAIAAIQRCPPLAQRFAHAVRLEMARIDDALQTDGTLSRAGQRRWREQLRSLEAQDRPPWENWIWQTPRTLQDQFDDIIQAWLNEPFEPSEAPWFTKQWRQAPRALAAARGFFDQLGKPLCHFLGVDLLDGVLANGQSIPCAFLRSPVDDATRWASLADVPLRFEQRTAAHALQDHPEHAQEIAQARAEVTRLLDKLCAELDDRATQLAERGDSP